MADALGPADLVFCSPPRDDVPLLDRLGPVAAAGFAGISLLPGDIWRLEEAGMPAAEIAARIADAGLAVREVDCIACWLPSHDQAVRSPMNDLLQTLTPERVIAAAARIGAPSVVVVEMMGTAAPSLDEAAAAFARVCDLAAEHGLKAQIEALPPGNIKSVHGAARIVEAAGRANGGLTVDTWHLFRGGSTLADLAAIPPGRIHTVQINDAPATPADDLLRETMNARLLPGEGDFDLLGFVRTLDAIGSTAPIGVEVFRAGQAGTPIGETADQWMRAARALLGQARGMA
ncbi:sugar phosphate isomerase/epimerase family protein [Sphingomonas jatrophae]|uniref:Sugar phosphate isomerase/epimerase n=1 Tax=Sphingomonas jatrophae TaxID=1166337 RepID=A0A1I6KH37_9SPHN|nr:sugar phosphate isomerase/epimerase family protein [Sphingomonas jatrophae]SFR90541.1 Sugar phosphate isomerase/epimerase [Sphingomonas jatrophae]